MRGTWIGGLRWVDRLTLSRVLMILGLVACLSVAASIAGHGPKRSGCGVSALEASPGDDHLGDGRAIRPRLRPQPERAARPSELL